MRLSPAPPVAGPLAAGIAPSVGASRATGTEAARPRATHSPPPMDGDARRDQRARRSQPPHSPAPDRRGHAHQWAPAADQSSSTPRQRWPEERARAAATRAGARGEARLPAQIAAPPPARSTGSPRRWWRWDGGPGERARLRDRVLASGTRRDTQRSCRSGRSARRSARPARVASGWPAVDDRGASWRCFRVSSTAPVTLRARLAGGLAMALLLVTWPGGRRWRAARRRDVEARRRSDRAESACLLGGATRRPPPQSRRRPVRRGRGGRWNPAARAGGGGQAVDKQCRRGRRRAPRSRDPFAGVDISGWADHGRGRGGSAAAATARPRVRCSRARRVVACLRSALGSQIDSPVSRSVCRTFDGVCGALVVRRRPSHAGGRGRVPRH